MRTYTTKLAFERHFRRDILPMIRQHEHNGVDRIMRREEWNNVVDEMVEAGELPRRAINWNPPW